MKSRWPKKLAASMPAGRLAADLRVDAARRRHRRDHVVAQRLHQLRRLGRLGRGRRVHDDQASGVRCVVLHRRHEGDAVVVGGDRLLQAVHRGDVARPVHVGRHDQRTVEPGPEALGQQVVGLPRGQRRGVVAGVGEGQAHAEHGQGQGHQDEHGHRAGQPGPALHEAAPAMPEAVLGWRSAALEQAGQMQLVDGVAREAEHGRQQGQGGAEHHEHGGDAGRGQIRSCRPARSGRGRRARSRPWCRRRARNGRPSCEP